MEPVCLFAIFTPPESKPPYMDNLTTVLSEITVYEASPEEEGSWLVNLTLWVALFADEGHHVLSVSARGSDVALRSAAFEILPRHSNLYLTGLEGRFGVTVEPPLNVFPLLLDGVGLAKAHLVAYPPPK